MTQHRLEMIDDAEEALLVALRAWQTTIWTAMPGIVQSVDFAKNTCSVQLALQSQIADPQGVTRWANMPMLVDCPIVFPGGGGYCLTFPLALGDEVLVLFANRCIDAWWERGGVQTQAELRLHDLSDGFAIPSPRSVPKAITNVSSTSVQLRNESGFSKVEIQPSGTVRIEAFPRVEIVGSDYVDISAYAEVSVHSDSKVRLQAPTIELVGNIVCSGGTLTHLGKNVGGTHTHGGVDTGSGTSGVPT